MISYLDQNKGINLVCKYWKIIVTEKSKDLISNLETKNPLKNNFLEINKTLVKQLKLNSLNKENKIISIEECVSNNDYNSIIYGEKKYIEKSQKQSCFKPLLTKNINENGNIKKVQFVSKTAALEVNLNNENDDKMIISKYGNLTELVIDNNTENNHNLESENNSINKNENIRNVEKNYNNQNNLIKENNSTEKTNSSFSSASTENSKNSPIKNENENENENGNENGNGNGKYIDELKNKNMNKNGFDLTKEENKERYENENDHNNDNHNYNNDNNDNNENDYDDYNDENGNFDHLLTHVKEIRSETQLTDLIEYIQNRYISIEHTDNEKKKLKRIIKGMKKRKNVLFKSVHI